ncbi:MAG: hypothetical protein WAW61_18675 [Methylococcaceae bacterium]
MRIRTINEIEQAFREMGLAERPEENKYCMIKVCDIEMEKEEEIDVRYENTSGSLIRAKNA